MLWLYDLPTWLMGLMIVVTFTALSVAGLYATRRFVVTITGPRPGHNEGVDAYIAAAAVFYGIVAGLIAVAAWEQYSNYDDKVTQEAGTIAVLYRDVATYPEPYGTRLKQELRAYTRAVIDGWPLLQHGVVPPKPAALLNTFQGTFYSFDPKNERERIIHTAAIEEFERMIELRRLRLHDKDAGLPEALWAVVIIGGILTVFLTYFLALERFRVHVAMTIVSSILVSLLIFMIAAVDHPFRGGVSIGPDSFQLVYEQLESQGTVK
ncbi:MAG: DUF4239 domain-containing protein [Candidatus Eremiobacteraeota bacterium]|nr:DUF4239 domain-containing protein [Candidatus Eremiobacteraeota bacterium]